MNIVPFAQWKQKKTAKNLLSDTNLVQTVTNIKDQVLSRSDEALEAFAREFDRVDTPQFSLKVTEEEFALAEKRVSQKLISALKLAKKNIEAFHRYQKPKSWLKTNAKGVQFGMTYSPIDRVGLYVPGGRAVYPSSVLMNAIPAKIAGVPNCVITTPPRPDGSIDPSILVAAQLCGIKKVFKVGGAQAIFALAYGTKTIAPVDKIVGPGNRFVTLAKQWVYGTVDIDKPAGPSEVLVYCDHIKYAPFAAAELLAQLEHDPDASAIAVSMENAILEAIKDQVAAQKAQLKRQEILKKSVANISLILTVSEEETQQAINVMASEHTVIISDQPEKISSQICHAGALFLGPYTPVTLGDYIAGPNHVLPTESGARFSSPLSVMDFIKFSSVLKYSKEALAAVADPLQTLTDAEGFDGHMNAVTIRL